MTPLVEHASCVASGAGAVLILGPSGAGKSALALKLIAQGGQLVSDDRTLLWAAGDRLMARAPDAIAGLIEARGLGLLRLPFRAEAEVTLVVDLGQSEKERLPPKRHVTYLGLRRDLVFGSCHDHFSAALLCYLTGSRYA